MLKTPGNNIDLCRQSSRTGNHVLHQSACIVDKKYIAFARKLYRYEKDKEAQVYVFDPESGHLLRRIDNPQKCGTTFNYMKPYKEKKEQLYWYDEEHNPVKVTYLDHNVIVTYRGTLMRLWYYVGSGNYINEIKTKYIIKEVIYNEYSKTESEMITIYSMVSCLDFWRFKGEFYSAEVKHSIKLKLNNDVIEQVSFLPHQKFALLIYEMTTEFNDSSDEPRRGVTSQFQIWCSKSFELLKNYEVGVFTEFIMVSPFFSMEKDALNEFIFLSERIGLFLLSWKGEKSDCKYLFNEKNIVKSFPDYYHGKFYGIQKKGNRIICGSYIKIIEKEKYRRRYYDSQPDPSYQVHCVLRKKDGSFSVQSKQHKDFRNIFLLNETQFISCDYQYNLYHFIGSFNSDFFKYYSKKFKIFIKTILLANNRKGCKFSIVPTDVVIHTIFPFFYDCFSPS